MGELHRHGESFGQDEGQKDHEEWAPQPIRLAWSGQLATKPYKLVEEGRSIAGLSYPRVGSAKLHVGWPKWNLILDFQQSKVDLTKPENNVWPAKLGSVWKNNYRDHVYTYPNIFNWSFFMRGRHLESLYLSCTLTNTFWVLFYYWIMESENNFQPSTQVVEEIAPRSLEILVLVKDINLIPLV